MARSTLGHRPLAGDWASRRADVERGAALVAAAMSADAPAPTARRRYRRLDSRRPTHCSTTGAAPRGAPARHAPLPSGLSVSSLVDLARDPEHAAQRLMRRLADTSGTRMRCWAMPFHDWVESFFLRQRAICSTWRTCPGAAD